MQSGDFSCKLNLLYSTSTESLPRLHSQLALTAVVGQSDFQTSPEFLDLGIICKSRGDKSISSCIDSQVTILATTKPTTTPLLLHAKEPFRSLSHLQHFESSTLQVSLDYTHLMGALHSLLCVTSEWQLRMVPVIAVIGEFSIELLTEPFAVPSHLHWSNNSVDFGWVQSGREKTVRFWARNSGSIPANLQRIRCSNPAIDVTVHSAESFRFSPLLPLPQFIDFSQLPLDSLELDFDELYLLSDQSHPHASPSRNRRRLRNTSLIPSTDDRMGQERVAVMALPAPDSVRLRSSQFVPMCATIKGLRDV